MYSMCVGNLVEESAGNHIGSSVYVCRESGGQICWKPYW